MSARKPSATVQLKLRMKEPLRARLEKSAEERGISMNAEMVARLERSFGQDDQLGGSELAPLFLAMGNIAKAIEEKMGCKFTEDSLTAISIWGACYNIFERAAAMLPTVQKFPELPKGPERWREQASVRVRTAAEHLKADGANDPTMTEACQEALDTARAESCPHELTKYMEQPLMLWARDCDIWVSDANAWKKGIEVAKAYGMEIG